MAVNKEDTLPAEKKRFKISKAKQDMLTIVALTSVVVGAAVVLSVHFSKYISFYGKVIDAKNDTLQDYTDTIKNIGVCKSPSGKVYTTKEIEDCNPNSISSSDVPGTLRYNIIENMAANADLESVARDSQSVCMNELGEKIDFKELYENETDTDQRAYYLGMMKMCSSLRVIPDALPAQKNTEALLASLNKIFIVSNLSPESLSPGDSSSSSSIDDEEETDESVQMETIPVTLSIEDESAKAMEFLGNLEKSIRVFDILTASVEWSGDNQITFQAQANAYYAENAGINEGTKTINASDKKSTGGSQ